MMNPFLGQLFLLETPQRGVIIKIITLHVDLSIWTVLLEMFLVLLVIELLFMKMMTMTDIWNDPQTIMMVIGMITVLFLVQNVPIQQW